MGKVLKDLALALVNATLILVAVCLFLAWQLSRTVEGLLANAAGQLQVVEPLRARMAETRAELAG